MKNKSAAVAESPKCKSEERAKKNAPAKNKNPITYFIILSPFIVDFSCRSRQIKNLP